jgi:NAD(P)-dependent dehydrogenase (short-subunit alcohol dehydrogenase family)
VLDVLVHTASTFRRRREVTADGLERMFATNHLGPFLLTLELMRSMQAAVAGARIFVVTAPATTKVDFDDLQGERGFGAFHAFGASKVMQLMFTAELARRIEKPGITVNAFHPGIPRTRLMRDAPFIARLAVALLGRPPQKSANDLRDLILDPMTSRVSGQFFKGKTAVDMPEVARVLADRERLWDISEKLVGLGPATSVDMPE